MEMKFGKQIRALRIKAGLTQEAFAKLLDIKRSRLGSWEYEGKEPDKKLKALFISIAENIVQLKQAK